MPHELTFTCLVVYQLKLCDHKINGYLVKYRDNASTCAPSTSEVLEFMLQAFLFCLKTFVFVLVLKLIHKCLLLCFKHLH